MSHIDDVEERIKELRNTINFDNIQTFAAMMEMKGYLGGMQDALLILDGKKPEIFEEVNNV